MPKFTRSTAILAGRRSAQKKNLVRGRYIVAYKLARKNAVRHTCFRADTVKECLQYIADSHRTDCYYKIYDYNWKEITP